MKIHTSRTMNYKIALQRDNAITINRSIDFLFSTHFFVCPSGSHILLEKLRRYRPKIAVFNGKLIYEVFSGKKEFGFGRQPSLVDGTDTVSFDFTEYENSSSLTLLMKLTT